jgi:hypothetical protein
VYTERARESNNNRLVYFMISVSSTEETDQYLLSTI